MIKKYLGPLTWAWVIIIGGLLITPRGPVCAICGYPINIVVGVISIVLGIAGFVAYRGEMVAGKAK